MNSFIAYNLGRNRSIFLSLSGLLSKMNIINLIYPAYIFKLFRAVFPKMCSIEYKLQAILMGVVKKEKENY